MNNQNQTVNKTVKISFLGLGTMGYHIAKHLLLKQSSELTIYNRTKAKAEKFAEEFSTNKIYNPNEIKIKIACTPEQAAQNCDVCLACVGNDNDVKQITINENGAFYSMKPNSLFVDHSTTSSKLAENLCRSAKNKNFNFIDAPLSGGESGAVNGQLSVMVGAGNIQIFEKAQAIIANYAKKIVLIGEVGAGQQCKMINQICICGTLFGLSEALKLTEKFNLNVETVLSAIEQGAAQSWQMQNRLTNMHKNIFNYGFSVDWMIKDLKIIIQESKKQKVNLTITQKALECYQKLSELGYGKMDTSILVKSLKEN